MENLRNLGNIKLIKNESRRNYLVSEPNDHTTNFFWKNVLPIKIKKTQMFMNKPVYLRLSIYQF